ncbi:RagB/SusD family nutrient uptake outer membrane protein [Parabacteroides sp. GYB001]|uniref:RagB/SusD family nutrient uptake outer membrane protein n=1 Tax=Parabacteroides leei TaxID=2939491 RepID=UPI0020172A8B|nr:RagB/SusD family nutrient uptake outer membrane protein [Parabacteroides leei]MCL3852805.1 RagB/SusD family nutrient uptake outer membrane protein [Parabacteroides leei]
MKKYAIILGIGLCLSLGSCNDFLDVNPKTEISEEEYFKNENEIFKALTGVYDILQAGHNDPHYYFSFCADIMSDDLNAGGGDATDLMILQVLDNFTMSPITAPHGLWNQYYKGINRANTLIAKTPGASGNPENLSRMNTEAKLLRSIYYYWLWLYYGNLVILTENITNPDEYYTQHQGTADDVYNFLIKELDEIIGKLPMTVTGDETGRLTDAVARTLKAKIVLQQNDETRLGEIIKELEVIINSSNYSLVSDFEKMWLREGEHCEESIFEVEFSVDDNNRMPQISFPRGFTDPTNTFLEGWGFGTMQKATVDMYEDIDIRKYATVFAIDDSIKAYEGQEKNWSYTPAYQNTGYFLKKYAPRVGYYGPSRFDFENNVRVFRYADVLLMASEALLRSGGSTAKAQEYFSMVYKRARPSISDVPTVNLDILYLERHKEFVGEGHRYWDLIRTNQATTYLSDKGWKQHNRYLPIPDSEISKAQGSLTQNEGYN